MALVANSILYPTPSPPSPPNRKNNKNECIDILNKSDLNLFHFTEEHLQFVFKYIDPKDEDRPFVFTVAITSLDKYNGKTLSH